MFKHHAAVLAAASSIFVSGCSDALLSGIGAKYRPTRTTATATATGTAYSQTAPYGAVEPEAAMPATAPVIVTSGDATGPSGTLALDFELPRTGRGVQALPESTAKVVISITAAKLSAPVKQAITRSQFIDGKAKMLVEKLPLGEVKVEIKIYDDNGSVVTSGTATAAVAAGTITPVLLNLIVKEETGGIAIRVDSKTEYSDTPIVSIPESDPAPAIVDDSPRITLEPIKFRDHTRSGYLSAADKLNPTRSATFKDDYALVGAESGDTITVAMSAKFDAFIQIVDARTGDLVSENDDGGPGNDATVTFTVRHGKSYIVRATSYRHWATGAYTLTTTAP